MFSSIHQGEDVWKQYLWHRDIKGEYAVYRASSYKSRNQRECFLTVWTQLIKWLSVKEWLSVQNICDKGREEAAIEVAIANLRIKKECYWYFKLNPASNLGKVVWTEYSFSLLLYIGKTYWILSLKILSPY